MFTPIQSAGALYLPPYGIGWFARWTRAIDETAERYVKTFGGVVLVEATKQIYAATAVGQVPRRRRRVLVPLPGRAVARGHHPLDVGEKS
jgi:hypothetical protein